MRRAGGMCLAALALWASVAIPAFAAPPELTRQRTLCAESRWQPGFGRIPTYLNLAAVHRIATGKGQRIAIIDTGVTPHPRLPRLRGGGDFVSRGTGLDDCDAHGTLVAGLLGATASADDSFVGVAPGADLLSIRQTSRAFTAVKADAPQDAPTVGDGYGTVQTLAWAVRRAVQLGATIINISEVACAPTVSALGDGELRSALQAAAARDVTVIAAAGNLANGTACATQNTSAVTTFASPARFDDVVFTVGAATSDTGAAAPFSLRGPWVDVAAPGTGVVSLAANGSGLATALVGADGPVGIDGTSFATPIVAGLVALLREHFPDLSSAAVLERITRTAHGSGPGRDPAIGAGVVDLLAALTAELPALTATDPAPIRPPAEPPRHSLRGVGVTVAITTVALLAALAFLVLRHPQPPEHSSN